ncbi:MAG: S-adenosylmethionine:tRNA ribosyltransferase-isomerase [Frankiales bacterium]|nr:S-adenosylmethionine:tRNA ribosyltransferase-isomerase [Frankiales bacterium]
MSFATTNNASVPPEVRGLARDEVRLLVATPSGLTDTLFRGLPSFLKAGDLVVVNTSATLPAALDGQREDRSDVVVHFATELDDRTWIVEVRPPAPSFGPVADIRVGERISLPAGAWLEVLETRPGQVRLHRVSVALEGPVTALLERRGRPIAYGYVPERWPLADYQTLFAVEPGSAEMPSAGRPFTPAVVTDLARRGVLVTPILLHTGVSSAELGEPPSTERFRVPAATASLVQHVKRQGGRVVAVGTTVTRALETTGGEAGSGWTDLVLTPERPARVVDGLITGWHDPGASHVKLLESVAGPELVARAYAEAQARGFLWHEFGDSCLLLP